MSQNRITKLATDYIDEMYSQSGFEDYETFLDGQRKLYRKNASHLGDCFTETSDWAEDEGIDQGKLEAEIVRQIMDGQEW